MRDALKIRTRQNPRRSLAKLALQRKVWKARIRMELKGTTSLEALSRGK